MHQTKKGSQWYFGMKAHIGVDAGAGYIHSVSATAASVHDLDEVTKLVRADDEVVYTDAGYQGVDKRKEITEDEHLSRVRWRVAPRKEHAQGDARPRPGCGLRAGLGAREGGAPIPDRQTRLRVHQDPLPGMTKNLNHLHMLFASANWLMRSRAVVLTG